MIRTLAWKEYREHRSIWVALAVLAAVLMISVVQFVSPEGIGSGKLQILWILALIGAGTYGLVCGSMMFAGEGEAGTLAFLDALTVERTLLWRTKLAAGAVLTTAQALAITAMLGAVGFRPERSWPLPWPGWVTCSFLLALNGWFAFAWGMLFSALCRNVLLAAGLAAVAFVFSVALSSLMAGTTGTDGIGFTTFVGMLSAGALLGSRLGFCGDDADRRRSRVVAEPARGTRPGTLFHGLKPLLWLMWGQGRVFILVLAVTAPLLGLLLLHADLPAWPLVTFLIGVGCGLGPFTAEQAAGSFRFLGDQRLPLGRVWTVKTGFWLTVAAAVALLVLVVGVVVTPEPDVRQNLYPVEWNEPVLARLFMVDWRLSLTIGHGAYLGIWLLYAFSITQLFTLIARKTVASVVLALPVSAVVLVLWLPSLIMGGVSAWQLVAVPVFLLTAARLAVWPWSAGRLLTERPVLYLAGCGVLAAAWMAGCLWYRILEVPEVGEPFDVQAYVAAFPTAAENQAGRLMKQAARELEERMQRKNAGNDRPMQQLSAVLRKGWKEAGPELEQWLDRTFEGKWAQDLREAAAFPPGMILDPRSGTGFASRPSEATREGVRQMTMVLQARFLQHQARGDSSAALDDLAMLLAVSRTIRNHAPSAFSWDSRALELETLTQFDAWLRQVGPRPALLRRALDELNRHEAERPPLADQVKAGYLEYQNSFDNPPSWLWKQNDPAARLYRLGYQLVAFARQAPWERARIQRIADALFAGWLRAAETDYWKLEDPFIGVPVERPRAIGRFYLEGWQPASEGPAAVLGPARLAHLIDASTTFGDLYPGMWGIWGRGRKIEAEILRRLQSARLKTALALYQIDKKNPPQTLDDLVPHYLPEVPVNPLTGHNLELGDLKEGKP